MAAYVRVIRKGVSGGRFRSVSVRIDSSNVGTMAYGSENVFTVAPGHHVISVALDMFFGSADVAFDIVDGQTVSYICREPGLLENGFPQFLKPWFLKPKEYLVLEPTP